MEDLKPGDEVLIKRHRFYGTTYIKTTVSRVAKTLIFVDVPGGQRVFNRKSLEERVSNTFVRRDKLIVEPVEIQKALDSDAARKLRCSLENDARAAFERLASRFGGRNAEHRTDDELRALIEAASKLAPERI